MKTLLSFLCALCVSALGQTFNVATANVGSINGAGAPAGGYLVNQNFEGTGYDNSETWTETAVGGSVVNEDFTDVVLAGSQSLRVYAAGQWDATGTKTSFAAQSEVWAFFEIQMVWESTVWVLAHLQNSDSDMAYLYRKTATVMEIVCGGATAEATFSTSSGIPYFCWLHYTKGTGANALLDVYLATTSTRPGSPTASITTGTSTNDVNMIRFNSHSTTTGTEFLLDRVLVDDAAIGNNPS